ncbi:MAG: peptidyl-prolyl cis-trans isomerase C [Polyangiales bacterium]
MERTRIAVLLAPTWLVVGLSLGLGCGGEEDEVVDTPEQTESRHGLSPEQAAETLATVGDETITLGEFAERLADQSPYLRTRFNTPERRREFLDNLIRFEILAQEAERRDLDELPSVVRTRNRAMIQQMMRELFEEIQPEDITEADIEEYYTAHVDEFRSPAQMRVSVIAYDERVPAAAALEGFLAHPEDMDAFRTGAAAQSTPALAARRGDVGFVSVDGSRPEGETGIPAAVATVAFEVPRLGGFGAEVIAADGKFWIVKLTGRRAPMNRTIEESSRTIRQRLWSERRDNAIESFVDGLREDANIEIDRSALEHVRIGGATPPAPEATP